MGSSRAGAEWSTLFESWRYVIMARAYILYRIHRNDLCGVHPVEGGNAVKTVERMQRCLKRYSGQDGITWQLHEGDIISALIASHKMEKAAARA